MKLFTDMVERAFFTYVQAFLGVLLAAGPLDMVSLGVLKSAALAAIPAVLSVVKSWLASFIGDKTSAAALLPSRR